MTDFSIAKLLNAAAVQLAPRTGPVLSPPVSPAMLQQQQYWRHMMTRMPLAQQPSPRHYTTAQYIWTQLWLQQQHRPAMLPTCPPDLFLAYIQAMAAGNAQPTPPAAKPGLADPAATKLAARQQKKGDHI
jgi:hypothetical protein